MKQMLLRLVLISVVSQVTLFSNAHAAMLKIAAPFEVNIPNLPSGFEFSVTGDWLQPTASNVYYGILTTPLPLPTPNWRSKAIDPSYSFGYALAARYMFACTGNDVGLSWDHLYTTDSDSFHAIGSQFVAPFYEVGPNGGAIRQAHGKVKFKFDVINLDAGQFVNLGQHVRLHLFGGLSGAYLKQELTTVFQDNLPTFVVKHEDDSRYLGIGPRFGLDTTYYVGCGFGVTGEAAGSMLIGTLKTNTSFTSSSPQLLALGIVSNHQAISADDTTQVVPGFDAKLGLNYTHQFCANTILRVEAGYRAATYFNAINQFNPSTVVQAIELGTVAVATMAQTQSNFGVNGPYLTVSIKI